MGRQRRYQGRPRRALLFGTAPGFPLQGDRRGRPLRPCGQTRNDLVGPRAQGRLTRVPVPRPKHGMERGGTGGSVGEAEGLRHPWARVASPCSHSALTARATHYRPARQGHDGGERLAFPARLAHGQQF
jgi:hypothetical protein